jgi:hypothetical protein
VRWLDPDIVGTYNGKHDRLPKCDFTLTDDSARSFFLLYNCLRKQFSANLFHPELLPDLAYIFPTLDLTTTPVDARSFPPVGKDFGGCVYPPVHWQDEHQRLGRTLSMLFTSNKVLNNSPTGLDALSTHTSCRVMALRCYKTLLFCITHDITRLSRLTTTTCES